MIKITMLGTSDAIPSARRNHTAILLTYKGENILIDCGEGTQRQFRKARLNPCKINRILLTHWHGDHVLGLIGLFQTLVLSGYSKKMEVYGPVGTQKFMRNFVKIFIPVLKFTADVKDLKKQGKFLEAKEFYIGSKKMTHGNKKCNAYSFVEKGQIR
ncbi:MBL fold metallo-hydrolase, partial [Nanoarchaeota archaeon]